MYEFAFALLREQLKKEKEALRTLKIVDGSPSDLIGSTMQWHTDAAKELEQAIEVLTKAEAVAIEAN